MSGNVVPLRPGGNVVPLRPDGATHLPIAVTKDPSALPLARALYVAQRTLDDGPSSDEVLAWCARRDLSACKLIRHLQPETDEADVAALALRLVAWLESSTRRQPEQVLTYARTLCVPAAHLRP